MRKKNKDKNIKTIFLYGKQNKGKVDRIQKAIESYNQSINKFIHLSIHNPDMYLAILNNKPDSSISRKIEKENRDEMLGSAYSQSSQDHAVKELHNHFNRIRDALYKESRKNKDELHIFYNSITLLNACLTNQSTLEVIKDLISFETLNLCSDIDEKIDKLEEKIKNEEENGVSKKHKNIIYEVSDESISYHLELYNKLRIIPKDKLSVMEERVRFNFFDRLNSWKVPYVKDTPLQLDKRTYTILKSHNLKKYSYVISVKLLGSYCKVNLPFNTSKRGRKRLNMYKNCSPTLCLSGKNIKLSLPVESKVKTETNQDKIDKMKRIAADAGITKLLSTSDGKYFGSFKGLLKILEELERKEGNRSTLRNKMREYQRELRKIKNKSWMKGRCEFLRKKIFNIAKTLSGKRKVDKFKRVYAFNADKEVSMAVKAFIKHILSMKTNVLVILEDLEIDAIDNESKKQNKRISSWARGKLFKKLIQALKWYGINYEFVNPAYTSQSCPICYYTSKENRKYENFKCKCCGHTDDADHNASINIENRVDDYVIKEITNKYRWNKKLMHEEIKKVLNERNLFYQTCC